MRYHRADVVDRALIVLDGYGLADLTMRRLGGELGVLGLPVFAEHSSGLGVFSGPSAGYLYSFPIAAALAGFLVKYVARERRTRAIWVFACSITASILVIHPMGIAGMKLYFDVSWHEALTYDTPFWLGDILKTALVALVAAEVFRAFPWMQRIDR